MCGRPLQGLSPCAASVCLNTVSHCHSQDTYAITISLYRSNPALDLVIGNNTSTHLVWLQRYQWCTIYGKQSMEFWATSVTLTVDTAIQHFRRNYDNYTVRLCLPAKGSAILKPYSRNGNVFTVWALTVTLTLGKPSRCMLLLLLSIQHFTVWWWWWWWWLLLYSAILRSRADSLRSHVILHAWLAFHSTFLNIHRSGVLTVLAWLVPHETAAISARSVYTIQPCTVSLHAKPHA